MIIIKGINIELNQDDWCSANKKQQLRLIEIIKRAMKQEGFDGDIKFKGGV